MKRKKSDKLRKLGYRVTNAQEFLELSDEEMAVIELKISLIEMLRETRRLKGVTQQQLARLVHSSQPRIAMMEQGRPDVSLDLICRALFALGVGRKGLGQAIISSKAA